MSILLALAAAVGFGVADFAGGTAARRARPLAVTVGAQLVGLVMAPLLVLSISGVVSAEALLVGVGAGVFGGAGLALYFTAMRDGPMGAVAPLSAVAAAALPVAAGIVGGERPSALAVAGIALALPAVWLASAGEGPIASPPPGVVSIPTVTDRVRALRPRRDVALGLASGASFGLFFVLLDAAPTESGAWPLVGAKVGSVGAVLALLAIRRTPPVPARAAWGLVLLSGVLDMLANLLFLLATRQGLLSLVAVISSQYPVVVIVLSIVLLREHLARSQRVGAACALVAVALISLG